MEPPWFTTALIAILFCLGLFVLYYDVRWLLSRILHRRLLTHERLKKQITIFYKPTFAAVMFAITFIFAVCLVDGFFIEPNLLTVNEYNLYSAKFVPLSSRILIAHITDLHFEGWRSCHDKIIRTLHDHRPDLMVFTGDYVNLSTSQLCLERLLQESPSVSGMYAVLGNWDDPETITPILEKHQVQVIEGKVVPVQLKGIILNFIGVECGHERQLKELCSQLDPHYYNILLTHIPDLIPPASEYPVDLCLCGHTHGGQVRLPFYGALITLCHTGKRFEMGRYQLGSMAAYVSRGIGMEGGPAPRVRFLCPPEVVFLTLRPHR